MKFSYLFGIFLFFSFCSFQLLANENKLNSDPFFELNLRDYSNSDLVELAGFDKSIIVNESTWTDSNGDYGIIICLGTIDKFLDKSVILNLGCSGRNQDDEKFTGNIVRKSDALDAGVGVFTYFDGTGKFERLIGRKCNLAVRYIDEFTFYRHRCK